MMPEQTKMPSSPKRIVCLSAEAADWLWRIGAWDRVVGVTAFFKAPREAAPRPRIGGFSTARFDKIAELNPDLIITFSDVQASLACELMRRGFAVLATNQRTFPEIQATLGWIGALVDCKQETKRWLAEFRRRLAPVRHFESRPRVYFEEWNGPLVTGIAWISELLERAGGIDVFANLRHNKSASDRVVAPEAIRRADPQVIFASWCGRPVQRNEIASRPGWSHISAVNQNRIYEIPGEDILQPGFQLVQGFERMKQILSMFQERPSATSQVATGLRRA